MSIITQIILLGIKLECEGTRNIIERNRDCNNNYEFEFFFFFVFFFILLRNNIFANVLYIFQVIACFKNLPVYLHQLLPIESYNQTIVIESTDTTVVNR